MDGKLGVVFSHFFPDTKKIVRIIILIIMYLIFSGINTSRMRSWILSYLRRHHHITIVDFNQCSLRQYCSYSWNGYFAGRSQSLSAKLRTKVHESYKQNNASRLVQLPRCSRIFFYKENEKIFRFSSVSICSRMLYL